VKRLLLGGLVVPCDGSDPARRDVLLDGDRIAALEPAGSERLDGTDAERIHATDRIVLPGLVDAHVHPELILLRGLMEGMSLHDWDDFHLLHDARDWLASDEGLETMRVATRAALAESLLAGVTTVGTYGLTQGMDAVAAECMHELGLRGWTTVRDASFTPLPDALPRPHMYRLHAEEALTDAELRAAAGAHQRGEWLVMHVAETETRVRLTRERFGTSPIRLLARYGLLSPRVLLSHAVHLEDEEVRMIADAGAPVVASPSAEMKLGDGIAPVRALLEAGATVALGTDAAVCNNGADLLLEARHLGLLQGLRGAAGRLSPQSLLDAATHGGAVALARPGDAPAGRLAVGAAADLTLLDARAPALQPLLESPRHGNVVANVVYSATGRDCTDVMVAGEWRVRERKLLGHDHDALVRDLTVCAHRMLEHNLTTRG